VTADVNITADGIGIEMRNRLTNPAPAVPGLGIAGMRERATAVGGVVAVHDDDGEFVVWAYLPYLPAVMPAG
jgi:signal transduction histidine kinase